MEIVSYFSFLQEQIKDIIIILWSSAPILFLQEQIKDIIIIIFRMIREKSVRDQSETCYV